MGKGGMVGEGYDGKGVCLEGVWWKRVCLGEVQSERGVVREGYGGKAVCWEGVRLEKGVGV